MNTTVRLRTLALTVLLVLSLSAIATAPVLADSGTTPPPSTTGYARTTSKSPPNSLSQVPSGTKVVVLDSSGNKVPLGSQAAADIVSSGDPIWCPSTVASPVAGLSGCSPLADNTNLYTLTFDVENHVGTWTPTNTNSTIWIMQGPTADSSTLPSVLDGSVLTALSNFTLTLNGGWTGSGHNVNMPSVLDGLGSNNVQIQILNWHNTVTLSNLQIENSTGDGFVVSTTKNIVLTNILSFNNGYDGADLSNTNGTGMVTITNSTFNQNDHSGAIFWGLDVNSNGAITLTGVTVDNNSDVGGARLDNCNNSGSGTACTTSAHSPVTITASDFSDNSYFSNPGLQVDSNGAIKLTDVTANGNGQPTGSGAGALLNNCNLVGSACTTNGQGVTLTGTNTFDGNAGYGLNVLSGGTITSGSLSANDNGAYGTTLDNHFATSVLSVSLTGTSSFSANVGDGLDVYSRGAISVNNITADYNSTGYGAYLMNAYSSTTPSAVKVTGTNWFDRNYENGFDVISDGAISLNNINADYNGIITTTGYKGLYANNVGASTAQIITLTGNNTLNYNRAYGADLESTGAITVNNVTAVCNSYLGGDCVTSGVFAGSGLYIDNITLGPSKPQVVTMLGTNNLSLNLGDGLDVVTYGAIKINNLTANSNAIGYGANLSAGAITGAVTLTGTNTFDFNFYMGLDVHSNGAITVSNLNVVGNTHTDGADLINTSGTAGVILSGVNTFNANYGRGLLVQTNGAITVSNLNAVGNKNGDGADLSDTGGTAGVTLTGVNTFDSNYGHGLYVSTNGAIAAGNLNALFNGTSSDYYGVDLDNTGGTAGVTLNGTNVFDSNYSDGLDISSHGAITTNNLTASFNGTVYASAFGVWIYNGGATLSPGVTLNGINTFDKNKEIGLYILSKGTITTNNITANSNTAYGAELQNNGSGTGSISVKGTNVFLGNTGGDGLNLYSNSTISVTHITADLNSSDGLVASTKGNVTVTCGSFILNSGYGWETGSSHAPSITLIGVDSAGNTIGYYNTGWGGTSVITTPRTCTLP